jgi:acyl-CoA synthetase (AMP-forming)/AMP-acid ligase II
VCPGEVGNVLLKHPEIDECCVIGVPDKTWDEAVKAICVCSEGGKLSMDAVRDFVGEHIAGFKKLQQVVIAEELPHVNN